MQNDKKIKEAKIYWSKLNSNLDQMKLRIIKLLNSFWWNKKKLTGLGWAGPSSAEADTLLSIDQVIDSYDYQDN